MCLAQDKLLQAPPGRRPLRPDRRRLGPGKDIRQTLHRLDRDGAKVQAFHSIHERKRRARLAHIPSGWPSNTSLAKSGGMR